MDLVTSKSLKAEELPIPQAPYQNVKRDIDVEPTVERIIMSCCGMTIWKGINKHGYAVESFGYSINKDSMICAGCYKQKQDKQRGIDNAPKEKK